MDNNLSLITPYPNQSTQVTNVLNKLKMAFPESRFPDEKVILLIDYFLCDPASDIFSIPPSFLNARDSSKRLDRQFNDLKGWVKHFSKESKIPRDVAQMYFLALQVLVLQHRHRALLQYDWETISRLCGIFEEKPFSDAEKGSLIAAYNILIFAAVKTNKKKESQTLLIGVIRFLLKGSKGNRGGAKQGRIAELYKVMYENVPTFHALLLQQETAPMNKEDDDDGETSGDFSEDSVSLTIFDFDRSDIPLPPSPPPPGPDPFAPVFACSSGANAAHCFSGEAVPEPVFAAPVAAPVAAPFATAATGASISGSWRTAISVEEVEGAVGVDAGIHPPVVSPPQPPQRMPKITSANGKRKRTDNSLSLWNVEIENDITFPFFLDDSIDTDEISPSDVKKKGFVGSIGERCFNW
jgi:hypothetical protein